ncbi:hypothetical protein [Pseudomonas asiatica]|uniref:hypothetical protein n=1 Tax=Pseudomonas asiatica TaxID=2219225 RepID=UPI00345B335E
MRLPVYPQDLARNRGFKTLAKRLRRQWCGPHPISLELAQEILAKGFGYRGFYDLRQESKNWTPGAPSPRFTDIRYGILTAAKAAMSPKDLLAVDHAELERLVAYLPLSVLIATTAVQVNRLQAESSRGTLIGGCISTFELPPELPESLTSCLRCQIYRPELNGYDTTRTPRS